MFDFLDTNKLRTKSYILQKAVDSKYYEKISEFLETQMTPYIVSDSLHQFRDVKRNLAIELRKEHENNSTQVYLDLVRPLSFKPIKYFKPAYLEEILEFYRAEDSGKEVSEDFIKKFYPNN